MNGGWEKVRPYNGKHLCDSHEGEWINRLALVTIAWGLFAILCLTGDFQ